jgi:nicotinate-nucleotide adenylyltransferase
MRRLCFGGSFNPIHFGHLRCARAAAEHLVYDRVVLIPSGRPPHKRTPQDTASLADASDRLAMCGLAAGTEPDGLFEVDDFEIRRGELSYTVDTANALKQRGWGDPKAGDKIPWLIGADQLNDLPTWHRPLDLLQEVHFVLMARPGFTFQWPLLPEPFQKLQSQVVEVPQIDIRATTIRQRVARGQCIEGLTPAPVIQYIHAHHLYQSHNV